jgi:Catechol dioxygenase N terminus
MSSHDRTGNDPLPPLIKDERSVTPAVQEAIRGTADPRLREVMDSLVRHLHDFILEVRPTEEEYEQGLAFIAALAHHTNETNNEVVLAADVLGLSTLIDLINNSGGHGETMSALLGPFYRARRRRARWARASPAHRRQGRRCS